MYLWRIDRLKKELGDGPLPQVEQFKYLLAHSLLFAATTIPLDTHNSHDTFNGVATVLLTVPGLYYIYHRNGGGAGDRLLEKYLSLGLVTFVRMLAIIAFPVMMLLVILRMILGIEYNGTDSLDTVSILSLEVVYFYLLGRHMRQMVKEQPNQAL